MELHFTVTKETKKMLIRAIENEVGEKAKYLGVPSCAYQIGDYTLAKDGTLSWDDTLHGDPKEFEHSAAVVDACVMAGFEPLDWADIKEEYEEPEEGDAPIDNLVITIPKDKMPEQAVENLKNLVNAKGDLIKKALKVRKLPITEDEENIIIDWFHGLDPEHANAYMTFVGHLVDFAREAKRVTAQKKPIENEKYEFRCFLLRLGFIGDDTKAQRKILMENLAGSAAFKAGKKGE